MTKKRFFAYLACVVAIVAAVDVVSGLAMSRYVSTHNLPGDYMKINYMLRSGKEDILILGSSVGMNSLIPSEFEKKFGLTCFNAGANDQAMEFHEVMLSEFMKRHSPKMVVLALRPHDILGKSRGRFGMLRIFYRCGYPLIDRFLEEDGMWESLCLNSALYRFNTFGWRLLLYHLKSKNELADGGFVAKPVVAPPAYTKMSELAPGDPLPEPNEEKLASFNSIVSMCRSAGARLAVVLTPYHFDYGETRPAGAALFEKICSERGMEFYDDTCNPEFSPRGELFFDNFHMNKNGAELYTKYFIERMASRAEEPADTAKDATSEPDARKDGGRTVVTIIDDDTSSVSAVKCVREMAERNGVAATFAAIARTVERNPELAEYLRDCIAAGHEIASHSYSHGFGVWNRSGPASEGFADAMEKDLDKADAVFAASGLKPSTFVYPYGNFKGKDYRRKIFEIVGKRFPFAFDSRGGVTTPDDYHPLCIGRFPMRSHNHRFMVERWLRDAAKTDGDKWIVLMTHSGKDDFSIDDLESFVKCAKSLGCEFMTASAAAEMWRKRGWMPSTRQKPEYSRIDEIADLVRFHWLYVLGLAVCGTLAAAAVVLFLKRKATT
jgi:peptidoglycan/xylan/chitin deacetylase (PgdA/CDA1 family)